ncbi:MAG: hypothetical protein ACXWU6_16435, partial [Allosphingosinicella sp.]
MIQAGVIDEPFRAAPLSPQNSGPFKTSPSAAMPSGPAGPIGKDPAAGRRRTIAKQFAAPYALSKG